MSRDVIERPRSREEAKRETRDALIQAGLAEFSERGLEAPSLDAICERAGYTRGAFYVHFRNRDDFISAVVERVLRQFIDQVIASDDRGRDLEQTIRRFTDALSYVTAGALPLPGEAHAPGAVGLQFHRVLEACARSPEIRGRFAAMLQGAVDRVAKAALEGQVSGTVFRDVDPEQVGTLLVALALGAISALETGVPFDAGRARDALLALLRPD